MNKSKIVDLVASEDGSYDTKGTKTRAVVKVSHHKEKTAKEKHKYMMPSGVDEFLSGVDVGLDLVESIKIRAIRMLNLRD